MPLRFRSLQSIGVLALAALGGAGPGASAQEPRAAASASDWKLEGSARLDTGYDTNVFRTDSATGDAFTRLGGLASAEREGAGGRFNGYAELDRKFYWSLSRADELEGFLDLTAVREFGALEAGLGWRSSYTDLRLLDREGNLLPRTTFASFSSRLVALADLELARGLFLAAEGGYRLKDYEETQGLTSLDYGEWSAEVGLTRYLPARLSILLQGSWDERAYHERPAADAAGSLGPLNPELRLRLLEAEARLRKRWGEAGLFEAAFALRGSEDLFEDELSYGQRSARLRLRHAAGGWSMTLRGTLTGRDFGIRRSGSGEPLEEDFLTLEAELERMLWRGAQARAGYALYRRSTNDVLGGYEVNTLQLGVVHAF